MSLKSEPAENIRSSIDPILENRLQAALHCAHPSLWLFILRTLAMGKPVTQTSIAGALGMSLGEAQAMKVVDGYRSLAILISMLFVPGKHHS